jgi:D-tyrosyl-tRNA(Tyr) deacylase
VRRAQVSVEEEIVGQIGPGLCVLVGVFHDDDLICAKKLAKKVADLRVFSDKDDKMNLSVRDVGGAVLAVSQFTLCADTRKGTRPSFVQAMSPEPARNVFEDFVQALREESLSVQTGIFRAHMAVELVNDGPVTIILDTNRGF